MPENEIPKAWLPADAFTDPKEIQYLDLFTELIGTGLSFRCQFVLLIGSQFELVVEARVNRPSGAIGEAEISLSPGSGYTGKCDSEALIARSFKKLSPSREIWQRVMQGRPVAHMVANHLFSGIKHLVGFDTRMQFTISTPTNQGQRLLDSIIARRSKSDNRDWVLVKH